MNLVRWVSGFRIAVVRPHVGDAVAIGNEVHGIAEPRRIDVLRIGPRRRRQIERLQIDDPHRAILSAAVVAALLIPRRVHAIGDAAPIGRNLSLVAARQRHRLLDAAFHRHRPESRRRTRRGRLPAGREHDPRAIRRPALHRVRAGMPRQAHRLAAAHGHRVDIGVARIVGAERDHRAVGRNFRIARLALEAREAPGIAAFAIDDPDVVRIRERDVGRADRRRA